MRPEGADQEDGDDAALPCPSTFRVDEPKDVWVSRSNGSPSRKRRGQGAGGGKPRSETSRRVRIVVMVHEDEAADLEVLSGAWGVPLSTLGWAFMHEWLMGQRGRELEFGVSMGQWRGMIELALKDREMGRWLRGVIADCAGGSRS